MVKIMKSENRFHPVFVCRVELFSVLVMTMLDYLFFVPPKKDVKMSKLNCKYLCTQIYLLVGWKARTKSKRYLSEQLVLQSVGWKWKLPFKMKRFRTEGSLVTVIASREQIGKWRSVPGIILHSNEALVDETPFGTIFLNFVKFFCRR